MKVVLDTNVLLDSKKTLEATDAPKKEIEGAIRIMMALTDPQHPICIAITKPILAEYSVKNAIEDVILRQLMDSNKIVFLKPVTLSGGQRVNLRKHVDQDDQQFLLAAAALQESEKKLFTRDPKTTLSSSITYCKKHFEVLIKNASSF